jgi:hypothetical protein
MLVSTGMHGHGVDLLLLLPPSFIIIVACL